MGMGGSSTELLRTQLVSSFLASLKTTARIRGLSEVAAPSATNTPEPLKKVRPQADFFPGTNGPFRPPPPRSYAAAFSGGASMKRYQSWILVGVFVIAYLAATTDRTPSLARGFDLAAFGRLPVVMSGGLHPIDTAARVSLQRIHGTDRLQLEPFQWRTFWRQPRTMGPTEWLLEVMTSREADDRRIFSWYGGEHTYRELQPKLNEISKEAVRVEKLDRSKRSAAENETVDLRNALIVYSRLRTVLQPNALNPKAPVRPFDLDGELTKFQDALKAPLNGAQTVIRSFAGPYAAISRSGFLAMVPPANVSRSSDGWATLAAAIVDAAGGGHLRPGVIAMARMTSAYADGNADVFNREVARYGQWLRVQGFGGDADRTRYEYSFTRVRPFVRAAAFYLLACMALCLPAFRRDAVVRRAGLSLLGVGLTVHAAGVVWLFLMAGGRPPFNVFTAVLELSLVAMIVGSAGALRLRPAAIAVVCAVGAMAMIGAPGSIDGALRLGRDLFSLPFALTSAGLAIAIALLAPTPLPQLPRRVGSSRLAAAPGALEGVR